MYIPNAVSWRGMNSCISLKSCAMSCESLVMLHNSSWLKSGVICLHKSIWLITFPKLDGPARFSSVSCVSMFQMKFGQMSHHNKLSGCSDERQEMQREIVFRIGNKHDIPHIVLAISCSIWKWVTVENVNENFNNFKIHRV